MRESKPIPLSVMASWPGSGSSTINPQGAEAASTQWRNVADQIRPKVPKLAAIMDDAEEDGPPT